MNGVALPLLALGACFVGVFALLSFIGKALYYAGMNYKKAHKIARAFVCLLLVVSIFFAPCLVPPYMQELIPPEEAFAETITKTVTYKYDADLRRIEKAITDGATTKYFYDGLDCLAEYDGNDAFQASYCISSAKVVLFGPTFKLHTRLRSFPDLLFFSALTFSSSMRHASARSSRACQSTHHQVK